MCVWVSVCVNWGVCMGLFEGAGNDGGKKSVQLHIAIFLGRFYIDTLIPSIDL